MRLRYRITRSTTLDPETIIKRTILVVKDNEYRIANSTEHEVSFDNKKYMFSSRIANVSRVNSGKFEIENNKEDRTIIFEYYPITISEFVLVAVISIVIVVFAIINDIYPAVLISLIFIGQLIFKHFNLKMLAKEMLEEI